MITITFYNNSAELERANKQAFLTNKTQYYGNFKEEVSVLHPTIIIESVNLPSFNYCYIDALQRYYFIDDITVVRTGLYEISCTVDILMTHYNTLIEQTGFIDTQENEYNLDVIDKNIGFEQGYTIEEYTLENDLYDNTNPFYTADAHYVLMGLGVTNPTVVPEDN